MRRAGPRVSQIKREAFLYGSALGLLALILGVPVLAGLAQTLLGSGDGWSTLLWTPAGALKSSLLPSIWLTIFSAVAATALSLLGALGLMACLQGRVRLLTLLSLPLIAIPHAALAQALTLALSPSGFLVRALSPWLTGYDRPPVDWLWDQHPAGWTLILALAMKELPFFLILAQSQSALLPIVQWQRTAASLGYGPAVAWWHNVLPMILPRLVLPLFVVLAFAVSVVDVAEIAGPSRLKTFAHALQNARNSAAPWPETLAGATVLLVFSLALIAVTRALLRFAQARQASLMSWARTSAGFGLPQIGMGLGIFLLIAAYACLALLPLETIAETAGRRTNFPAILPDTYSLKAWGKGLALSLPLLPKTLGLAMATTAASLILVIALLEGERRGGRARANLDLWIMVPLLIPQFAFLSGGAFLGVKFGLIPHLGFIVAVWFHALFVIPYLFLSLAPAYRGLDPVYDRAAAALGHSALATFVRVRLPLLLRPICFAAAWGIAVSLSLYLPTFFASAGRFETLLTIGVTQLAGKGDATRAVWGLLLLVLPFMFFGVAALISTLQARKRLGLRP